MSRLDFTARWQGSLTGAVIGAEFGYLRATDPARFAVSTPADALGIPLEPILEPHEEPGRINHRKITPFISLGVRTYLARGGRATPEDFAEELKNDAAIAGPVFFWDGIHSVQEVLKEGMHPRLGGFGSTPSGLICAAMPAVGVYHGADPDYAYLDGVELASVAQPRLGADWAGLCAAGLAAALAPDATPESVIDTVLRLAHENNRDLFYQMNYPTRGAEWMQTASDADFAAWWLNYYGRGFGRPADHWGGVNPMAFILPLLKRYADRPELFMRLVLAPQPPTWTGEFAEGRSPYAVIGGALLGALHGAGLFPSEWRAWAEPQTAPWKPLGTVITRRLEREREAIRVLDELAAPRPGELSRLHDKVYGCILAGAIGNAMGSPVEGRFYWEIDKDYPDGITTVLEPRRLESEDDNQMAMLLTETYLERDGRPVLARHFGRTWKDRLNRDHFFAMCMGHAYDLICQGWDPRITGHWIQVTGSTVMCMEPVGIFHLADPEFAAIDATAISYMYQRGLDVAAAAMLAATVAAALKPDATVDTVLQAALDAAPRTPLRTFDRREFRTAYDYISRCLEIAGKYSDVRAVRKELCDRCLLYNMIDPLELWGFSLAMFKVAGGDVRLSAVGGTNIGRDSDTIAGRAAMLAGALNGARGVPAEWQALFKPAVLEKIRRNAGRFADLLVNRRLPRLRSRQQL